MRHLPSTGVISCNGGVFARFAAAGRALPGRNPTNEIAKLLLEHAGSFLERAKAVQAALYLGMPVDEIEAYLDWLDTAVPQRPSAGQPPPPRNATDAADTAGDIADAAEPDDDDTTA